MTDDALRSERVLILAPTGRDAALAQRILMEAGVRADVCQSVEEIARQCCEAGALLIAEEATHAENFELLSAELEKQPAWSDLPVLIFAANTTSEAHMRSWDRIGRRANITLVDRPVRIKTLLSAVHTALRNRRQQYEVRRLMEQLESRLRERDKFLAILGHELRNPLTAILLSAQTIHPEDPESITPQVETIERQARQLSRLVNDLLDISRVTAGKIRLKKEPMDLNRCVRHALEAMDAMFRENELTVNLDAETPELWIVGDPVRIDQILTNLLTNAVKYTRQGGTIGIQTRPMDGVASVVIDDDGVGIAPEMLERIFDLFAQVDDTIDRSRGGMGVGLTLVRNLVELHGGSVHVHSDGVDSGSTFEFRLPLATDVKKQPTPQRTVGRRDGHRRIVLIEDNPDIRRLLEVKLRALGHEVLSAADGDSGLRMLLDHSPDVAIVDIGLPGLDGYEVARGFRKERGDQTLMIALTGYGLPDDRRKAEEAGFDRHLTKPPEFDELERVLAVE